MLQNLPNRLDACYSPRRDLHCTDESCAAKVLHNPGTMPDAELVVPGYRSDRERERLVPDVTAVFEQSYGEYIEPCEWLRNRMAAFQLSRERTAYVVNCVPLDQVQRLTDELRHKAGHIFVTDLSEGFYCKPDRSWEVFVRAMAM
jgi:hypothetical protein